MRNLLKYISIVFISVMTLISCNKHEQDFHKVRFHLTFHQIPQPGNSNALDVVCTPENDEDPAKIFKEIVVPGYEWNYEFWQLTNGQEVKFTVNPQLSYWFTMEIYVDDALISSRECVTSSDTYYSTQTLNQSGLNNDENTNAPIISFYYYE